MSTNGRRKGAVILGAGLLAIVLAQPALASVVIERVSVNSHGVQADGEFGSVAGGVSGTGRFVAFSSDAPNLVPGDTNRFVDVFVRDRVARTTTRVSVSSQGAQGNDDSGGGSLSNDGRYVAFSSSASTLVPQDTNVAPDVFVRDRVTGRTIRVSVASSGQQANGGSVAAMMSGNGRFVAFVSGATNLVQGAPSEGVYVRDLATGVTTLVSRSNTGPPAVGSSEDISADGRFVAFQSDASDLVAGDTNGRTDIFVRDRLAGTTSRASLSSSGRQANADSVDPSISANGRFVSYGSSATNLVPGDTNRVADLFVRDRMTRHTFRASVSSQGVQGLGASGSSRHTISADGCVIAFTSEAPNLVPGDTNGIQDAFARNHCTGRTVRLSVSATGRQGNNQSYSGPVSADGHLVAFTSAASNLVWNDTNDESDVFARLLSF